MIDYLNAIGDWSWGAVWLPVLAWTVLGAAVLLALRLVPGAYLRLHRDLRFALLLALPLGLLLGTVVPEFVGPAVIVPPVEGTLTDAGGSATALQVSDVGSRLSAATGLGVFSLAALLAAIGGLFLLAISAWRLRQIVGGAYPYAGLAPDLPANVSILVSDQISVPISSGLFRRVIVLPRENPADCRLAILHELTHHRQGDIARVFVTRGIGALFVAHPLVHGLMTRLDLLMEMICDQLVLSRSESDPARYASLLLSYVPSVGTSKLMPALFMGRSHQELVRRIASMKTRQRGSSLLSLGAAALLFAAASGVVGCACGFAGEAAVAGGGVPRCHGAGGREREGRRRVGGVWFGVQGTRGAPPIMACRCRRRHRPCLQAPPCRDRASPRFPHVFARVLVRSRSRRIAVSAPSRVPAASQSLRRQARPDRLAPLKPAPCKTSSPALARCWPSWPASPSPPTPRTSPASPSA